MIKKKGFVLLMVIGFMVILSVTILALMNISLNELRQGKAVDDWNAAFYAASAGAEIMYAHLRTISGGTVNFPVGPLTDNVRTTGYGGAGGVSVGRFEAYTYVIDESVPGVSPGTLGIRSTGTVNGRSATVLVKYGYNANFDTGIPIAAGKRVKIKLTEGPAAQPDESLKNSIRVTAPIYSNETIQWEPRPPDEYPYPRIWVSPCMSSSLVKENVGMEMPSFRLPDDKYPDGFVFTEEAIFKYYYTEYLTRAACPDNPRGSELGLYPGEVNYYSGHQVFSPITPKLSNDQEIIFVDGNVEIKNGSAWPDPPDDDPVNRTIIATGNIKVTNEYSSSNETTTYVTLKNVEFDNYMQSGHPIHPTRPMMGALVVYAGKEIDVKGYHNWWAAGWGASLLAGEKVTIRNEYDHMYDPVNPSNRKQPVTINISMIDPSLPQHEGESWVDPLGLPPGYKVVNITFNLQELSDAPPSGSTPRWPKWQME